MTKSSYVLPESTLVI